jgi:ABC-type antimicrobial peptide transport system, permease component
MTDVVRIFRRSSAALFGLGLVAIMAVLAVLAPWLAPRDPDAIDTARRLPPSSPPAIPSAPTSSAEIS